MKRTTPRLLALAAVLAFTLAAVPPGAGAAEPIENVWSFNGGKVAVQAQPDGSLTGTVVAPTKFSDCFHPVGEKVWTNMRRQPDGSYWGDHQWFFETSECIANPIPGLTAWRVLRTPSGDRFLRVCFSEPGSTSQPTIAADGSSAGATFGCSDSALVSPVPVVSTSEAGKYVLLPANTGCIGHNRLKFKLRDPVGDPFAKIVVRLTSGSIHRRATLQRHKALVTATLNLKGLTAPQFTVRVHASTVLGQELSAKRTYRRCGKTPHRRSHHRGVHA